VSASSDAITRTAASTTRGQRPEPAARLGTVTAVSLALVSVVASDRWVRRLKLRAANGLTAAAVGMLASGFFARAFVRLSSRSVPAFAAAAFCFAAFWAMRNAYPHLFAAGEGGRADRVQPRRQARTLLGRLACASESCASLLWWCACAAGTCTNCLGRFRPILAARSPSVKTVTALSTNGSFSDNLRRSSGPSGCCNI